MSSVPFTEQQWFSALAFPWDHLGSFINNGDPGGPPDQLNQNLWRWDRCQELLKLPQMIAACGRVERHCHRGFGVREGSRKWEPSGR